MGAPGVHAFTPVEAEAAGAAAPRCRDDTADAPPAPEFGEIAALAADLLRTPAALVSLADVGRLRAIARVGVQADEAQRIRAFCRHALDAAPGAGGAPLFVVNDAAADPRFADDPPAVGGRRVRFYAGAPIVAPDGRALGTVCVLSPRPRPFGVAPAERRRLASLAAMAHQMLENGHAARRAAARSADEAGARRAGEERLRLALGAAGGCAWELHPSNGQSTWDAAARDLLGMPGRLPFAEALGLFAHPDDARAVRDAAERAFDPAGPRRFAVEHRGPRPGEDGRPRWLRSVGQAGFVAEEGRRARAGEVRLVCATIDVTEQRAAAERQALILAEMNHRVKNTLTVVLALAEQSFRATGGGPEQERFHADLRTRLLALSRAHDLLTREAWQETDIAGVVRAALAPFGVGGAAARIAHGGPRVLLAPDAAVALAMALHELATNASKHGALSRPAGGVSLAWAPDGGGAALEVAWTERGGPPLAGPPTRRGFGLHLLERGLARQLGGEAALDFGGDGLSWRLRLPLGRRVSLG